MHFERKHFLFTAAIACIALLYSLGVSVKENDVQAGNSALERDNLPFALQMI